jgi:hypothetical protein
MSMSKEATRWRTKGSYLLRLASKTSLLEESRLYLLTYARLRDSETTRLALVNGGLSQRSRATRVTITEILQIRLTRWNPPTWVLDDLIDFAQDGHQTSIGACTGNRRNCEPGASQPVKHCRGRGGAIGQAD